MMSRKVKADKINKNIRNIEIPCIECGKTLNFSVADETVVDGEGIIAANIPAVVCQDCINAVLRLVADPPGLICIKSLNPVIAQEFLSTFEFLLPLSEAVNFFSSLFPKSELINEAKT